MSVGLRSRQRSCGTDPVPRRLQDDATVDSAVGVGWTQCEVGDLSVLKPGPGLSAPPITVGLAGEPDPPQVLIAGELPAGHVDLDLPGQPFDDESPRRVRLHRW